MFKIFKVFSILLVCLLLIVTACEIPPSLMLQERTKTFTIVPAYTNLSLSWYNIFYHGIELHNTESGQWDRLVNYGMTKLGAGSPDYTKLMVVGKWLGNRNITVLYKQDWIDVGSSMINFDPSGNMRLGVADTDDAAEKLVEEQERSTIPTKWTISPIGDELLFEGLKPGSFSAEYQGLNLVLVGNYLGHILGFVTLPETTSPDFYDFDGYEGFLFPQQGPRSTKIYIYLGGLRYV